MDISNRLVELATKVPLGDQGVNLHLSGEELVPVPLALSVGSIMFLHRALFSTEDKEHVILEIEWPFPYNQGNHFIMCVVDLGVDI